MYRILPLLTDAEIAECRRIATVSQFADGRITNPSLRAYRVPRFSDVPPIDVIVLDRPDHPSAGAGETPIIAVAPAIANAVHAATGRRLRSLPLLPEDQPASEE